MVSGFAPRCLDAWGRVVAACGRRPWVLEGVALQSTVRFMFEHDVPEPDIVTYWDEFTALVRPVDPLIVHLEARERRSPSCATTR